MNVFYIVNMNENNVKGLFTVSHEKIIATKKVLGENDSLNIISLQYRDRGIYKFLKRILNKKIFVDNGSEFILDGIRYRKEYFDVDIWHKLLEKRKHDYSKYSSFIDKYRKEIEKCDIIVAQWGYPHGRLAYHIGKEFGKPYMVQYHGSDIHTNPLKDSNIKSKTLDVLNNSYNNFFVSEKLKDAARNLGWEKNNYSITKNGVNFENFFPMDDEKKRCMRLKIDAGDKRIIGYVGSLTEVKRSDKIIDIFSRIDKEIKCKYVIVGDGDMRNLVESQSKEADLDVYFTGNIPRDEVNKYLNIMDVMILPSRREGFGSVIVEANACGVLAIGSDAGGIPEVISNPDFIIDDGENFEQRYADRVLYYLQNGWDREALIERIKNEYSWNSIVQRDLKVFMGALQDEK